MATSPDFSEYVDLTIYDTDAEVLLNQIVTYGRTIIPEWTPAAGEIEMMLAEVFAVGAADLALRQPPSWRHSGSCHCPVRR